MYFNNVCDLRTKIKLHFQPIFYDFDKKINPTENDLRVIHISIVKLFQKWSHMG